MNEKLNYTNLYIDEISSFVKNIRFVFIVKKNDFDLSKYHICFVILKNVIFDDKNSDLFCYIFLKDFLRRKLHS